MLLATPMRDAVADHRVRADVHQRAQLDVLADHGGGMHAGLELGGGIEAAHRAREGGARLGHADHGAVATALGHSMGTSRQPAAEALGLRRGLAAPDEGDVGGAGRFERRRRR